jgi:DNA-binding response OmpR family regulator
MSHHTILIIEDDPVVSEIYRKWLEREGYAVDVARDGQEGFYRLYDVKPAAVLLDVMLPKMNGIVWLKKVRAQREFGPLPVITLTNAYVPTIVQNVVEAGASAIYDKSTLKPHELLKTLHHLLNPPPGRTHQPLTQVDTPAACSSPMVPATERPTPCPAPSLSPFVAQESSYRKNFFAQAETELQTIHAQVIAYAKTSNEAGHCACLTELYRLIHTLTGKAAILNLHSIAQMGSAVEALVRTLLDKPSLDSPSITRTLTQAVELLPVLCDPAVPENLGDAPPMEVMVVDDDLLSRRFLCDALEKAFLYAENVEDPETALALADQRQFDAIFLDVRMPGMDGFTLCEKIRTSSLNHATPILFVTSLSDFRSRAQSTLSGGADFIIKPFTAIEITVKAILYSYRNRLRCRHVPTSA